MKTLVNRAEGDDVPGASDTVTVTVETDIAGMAHKYGTWSGNKMIRTRLHEA